jgi:hypothetical protein
VRVLLLEGVFAVVLSLPTCLLLGWITARQLDEILRSSPGLPVELHFFVATPGATLSTLGLLLLAGALGALAPMLRVARLPIAATLHESAD